MSLSPGAVTEFRAIYLEEYGEQLKADEAELLANKFINLVATLYQPIQRKYEKQT